MKAKYLSDGRKVVVIGQLNNVESVVQEVFVSDSGDQIPSGEKFTTKNLHDEPMKSWKEKNMEKINKQYGEAENEIKSIKREVDKMIEKRRAHAAIIASNLRQIDELESGNIKHLADVMARNIKWVCGASYDWYNIRSFDEFMDVSSAYDSGVKLITVHTKKDKSMAFRVGSYSDGSGNDSEYKFFNCDDSLNEYLRKRYDEALEKGAIDVRVFDLLSDRLKLPNSTRNKLIKKDIKRAEDLYKKELARITEQRDKVLSLKKHK